MNELSLFSGYGGMTLGLRLAGLEVRNVGYVEIDPYCQDVIKARIEDGLLDDAPIWPDIHTFDGTRCRGLVDIVTAGFPCQPHSAAGQRRGAADERNLWPDTLRVIGDVGPRWVLLENVPGILANGYAGTVVGELAGIGYDALWHLVPAASVGAPHLRWRWWCLAYPTGDRPAPNERQHEALGWAEQPDEHGRADDVAYPGRDVADAVSGAAQQAASGGADGASRTPAARTSGVGDVGDAGRTQPPQPRLNDERGGPQRPTWVTGQPVGDTERTEWGAYPEEHGRPGRQQGDDAGREAAGRASVSGEDVGVPEGDGRQQGRAEPAVQQRRPDATEPDGSLADAEGKRALPRRGGYERIPQGGPPPAKDSGRQGEGGRDLRHDTDNGGFSFPPAPNDTEGWARALAIDPSLEPAVRRVADGPSKRVAQLRALGNGVVPQVVAAFLRGVMEEAPDA